MTHDHRQPDSSSAVEDWGDASPAAYAVAFGQAQLAALPEPELEPQTWDPRWGPDPTEDPGYQEPTADELTRLGQAVHDAIRGPDKLSAAGGTPSGTKQPEVIFRRPADIIAEGSTGVDFAIRGLLAFGAITELDGRPKAAGKTTLLLHAIAALIAGSPFLERPTKATRVVLLTEQPPASLRPGLEGAGLIATEDLEIVLWRDVREFTWPELIEACVDRCEETGARVLAIDTLPAFAKLRGDAENDAGAALEALSPLLVAAADGLAIVVARHDRKGGGDVGDSGRGSSAFTGAVDVVLRLARPANPVRPTIRTLSALSRFDETPPELVIELTDQGYIVLGDAADVAKAEAVAAILATLVDEPMTIAELVTATEQKRTTVQAALGDLVETGQLVRDGAGKRGDPYRFGQPGFVSAAAGPYGAYGRQDRKQSPTDDVGELWEAPR